ncbi:MAG: hypothetical protein QNJ51_26755 [Calothrix sp. MO_167.B12]|nr:hypothetical protein [Calothrix sp. MO_167.B12]
MRASCPLQQEARRSHYNRERDALTTPGSETLPLQQEVRRGCDHVIIPWQAIARFISEIA